MPIIFIFVQWLQAKIIYLHTNPQQNQDSVNMDTVCRLYEVGRQRLAEEEEDEEDQVS